MPQRRSILVWLLLATFVVGGAAGPVVHQVQHGTAQIGDRAADPCHAPGVHAAEDARWTGAAVDLVVPDCILCTTRHLVVPPAPVPTTSPRVVGTTTGQPRSHVAATPVATHRFIRGPPSLSEARPA